jgi:hypothetical protein
MPRTGGNLGGSSDGKTSTYSCKRLEIASGKAMDATSMEYKVCLHNKVLCQVKGQRCKSRTGTARRRCGVPAVFQQHTCVSRGSSAREQEDLEVRGGVGIVNQSGSIVLSQGSATSSSSYPSLIAQPTTVTTGHREEYPSGHPPPTTIPWQPSLSPTEPRYRRALLTADPVHTGIHFPPFSSTTKATPRFAMTHWIFIAPATPFVGALSSSSYSLFSPTSDLIASI